MFGENRIFLFLIVISLICVVSACTKGVPTGHDSLESRFVSIGLVNIRDIDPSIAVDLMYTTKNNFMGKDMYGSLTDCYLQEEVARKLKTANELLWKENPHYRLILYDCTRPNSVQWKMWNKVKDSSKKNYVAHPKYGSNHNYGAAVDLSIAEVSGLVIKNYRPLDMGTPVDYLGLLAEPRHEQRYLREGRLTRRQIDNRLLLRNIMLEAGFRIVPNEWWHFNAFTTAEIRKRYKMIR